VDVFDDAIIALRNMDQLNIVGGHATVFMVQALRNLMVVLSFVGESYRWSARDTEEDLML
jgi:hypothetical protein